MTMMAGLGFIIYGTEAGATYCLIIGGVLALNGGLAWLTIVRRDP